MFRLHHTYDNTSRFDNETGMIFSFVSISLPPFDRSIQNRFSSHIKTQHYCDETQLRYYRMRLVGEYKGQTFLKKSFIAIRSFNMCALSH